jgi:surface carbohydrate biosynthesis protein (TIGR04326 family)
MILLFVFDSHLEIDSFSRFCEKHKIERIDIFPLTSDLRVHNKVKIALKSQGHNSICWLNTSDMIDEKVQYLREGICKWSADIGESRVKDKKLKQWFLLPGQDVSTWWFSLLSEKNTLKTNAFFQIAQIHAIQTILDTRKYDLCVIALIDKNLIKALNNVVVKLNIQSKILSVVYSQNLKHKGKRIFGSLGLFGDFSLGCFVLVTTFLRRCRIRRHLGSHSKRLPKSKSLLFVSYFPAVDKDAAQKGTFRNKYCLSLQDKLREMGIPIVWLFMYVPLNGYNFNDAVHLAATFAKSEANIFFLEEYLTFKYVIGSLFLWLRQSILSVYLYGAAKRSCLLSAPVGEVCEPIIRSLWRKSFCGSIGMQEILYYFIFKQVFKQISHVNDCLYCCEMHAWEKALNAAKKRESQNIRTIGFLHASVSRNNFHFFYDQSETIGEGRITDLPLPDVVVCSSQFMYSLLAESGYPKLEKAEAVRHMYLDKILSSPEKHKKNNPVLLVAGSIVKTESINLITLVNAVFPKAETFDIWFKGHPAMPFEKLFDDVGIDASECGYLINHDNISECLDSAWAVLVPSSTVSIEALAFGCEVIVPVFPDSMHMNPLADFKGFYHEVTFPEELKETMCKIANGYTLHSINEYKEFVRKYWYIDMSLSKWLELLVKKK